MKPIEKVSIDLTPYEGKKAKIEKVEVVEVKSVWVDGKQVPKEKAVDTKCLKVSTEKLSEIEVKGEKKELRASELFNLVQDDEDNWGFSTNEKAKLNIFMKKMKVTHPEKLIGKEVLVLEKKGFLSFNTE